MMKADKFIPLLLVGVASVVFFFGVGTEEPYREDALAIIEMAVLVKDCLRDDEKEE